MVTLRCTQVVRARLRLPKSLAEPAPAPATSALGDWYVHLVRFGHRECVMATSERSLSRDNQGEKARQSG